MLRGMTESEKRGWRPSRTVKIVAVLVVLIAWTAMAGQWADKGCGLPRGYSLVVMHGTPDRSEGCEDEPSGPVYTDDYYG
ncbi:hypothetical protein OV320_2672 [Actinobacteria bacterium OV320]|jgi:hypothetical protein|nr:hypothetical protein OV320_2672 [Actinobacteria bacterium OV320]